MTILLVLIPVKAWSQSRKMMAGTARTGPRLGMEKEVEGNAFVVGSKRHCSHITQQLEYIVVFSEYYRR